MTTPIHAGTHIKDDVICFQVNQTTLNGQSLFTMPEFIHPHEVEQKVSAFNDVSKDLIVEYHYTRVDKNTLTIQALFKPLFTKLGESQKYAHFRIDRDSDRTFKCERLSEKPQDINVRDGIGPIPVRSVRVSQMDHESVPYLQVEVRLNESASSYKNINVVVGFVKKLMQSVYEHVSSESA